MEKKIELEFVGIDSWNRAVFKTCTEKKHYVGCIDKLFQRNATKQEVVLTLCLKDLVYFGTKFDCEPEGTPPNSNIDYFIK
jgi:hypothetical protein